MQNQFCDQEKQLQKTCKHNEKLSRNKYGCCLIITINLTSSPSQIPSMGFFVLKDYKVIVDVHLIQGMRCIMCHGDGKAQSCESSNNTRDKKGFTFNLKHGINNMKKHVEMSTQLIWHDTN